MQSLSDLKNQPPFDETVLERMSQKASALLSRAAIGLYTQALVLCTDGGEYGAVISNALTAEKAEEHALLNALRDARDTRVRYVLCMWGDGNIDLPSHAFRILLRELDSQNDESLIFVNTKNGLAVVKLQITVK